MVLVLYNITTLFSFIIWRTVAQYHENQFLLFLSFVVHDHGKIEIINKKNLHSSFYEYVVW